MYSSKKHLQARFLPTFRGRPRTPNPPTPSLNPTSRPFANGRSRGSTVHDRLSFCEDDLLDLDSEDLSEASQYLQPESQGLTPHNQTVSFLSRSRSSLSRIKNITIPRKSNSRRRAPLLHSSYKASEKPTDDAAPSSPVQETTALILAFPCPPSSTPLELRKGRIVSIETSEDESSSIFNGQDPFRAFSSPTKDESLPLSAFAVEGATVDPNTILPSPPGSCIATPTSIAPSAAISSAALSPFRKSIQRLKSLKKGNFFSFTHLAQRHQPFDNEATSRFLILPELSFDSTPLSTLLHEDSVVYELVSHSSSDKAAYSPTIVPLGEAHPIPKFPLIRYECVDPRELRSSPAVTGSIELSPSATALLPPTPSWLSRDIRDFEFAAELDRSLLHPSPPSPAPIPIPPRFALPVSSHPSSPVGLFGPESRVDLELPGTPQSTDSSVAVYSHTKRLSHLSVGPRPASVNRLSVLHYRQSLADNRKSVQSFITCASVAFVEDKDDQLPTLDEDSDPAKPRFYLLLHPPSPEAPQTDVVPTPDNPPLSPLELFNSNKPLNHLPDDTISPIPTPEVTPSIERPAQSYQVFVPPPSAYKVVDERFPLPNYLIALARSVTMNPMEQLPPEDTEIYGKPMETVDYGDEVDYGDYEWFKEPPTRPEPPAPQPAAEPYVPPPGVIEQNEMFEYALKCAPNVVFSRYKQFGQLGVLGWCAEFSEMIDALKGLGFEGNMFVSTRTQALKSCAEILQLDMPIEMQIIIMYMSSQVSRLRRFLDSDTQYNDYPQPNFPVEPSQYTS